MGGRLLIVYRVGNGWSAVYVVLSYAGYERPLGLVCLVQLGYLLVRPGLEGKEEYGLEHEL